MHIDPHMEMKSLHLLHIQAGGLYSGQFTNPQLSQLSERIAGEHRARYDRLLGYLNSHG